MASPYKDLAKPPFYSLLSNNQSNMVKQYMQGWKQLNKYQGISELWLIPVVILVLILWAI